MFASILRFHDIAARFNLSLSAPEKCLKKERIDPANVSGSCWCNEMDIFLAHIVILKIT